MTTKKRLKNCGVCGNEFTEKKGDSNKQWVARSYCSKTCSNKNPNRITSIFERLKKYQIVNDGCWGWSGTKDRSGYGIISARIDSNLKNEKAHRVSYEEKFGKIPNGMNVCHKCDNPECTNPDHLFLGTQKDNMMDCSKKGRLNHVSFLNLNHEKALTKEQVSEILKLKFVGRNGRGSVHKRIDVAAKYGVSVDLIKLILKGEYNGR